MSNFVVGWTYIVTNQNSEYWTNQYAYRNLAESAWVGYSAKSIVPEGVWNQTIWNDIVDKSQSAYMWAAGTFNYSTIVHR